MKRVLEQMKWPVISISEGCSVAAARAKLGYYEIDRLPVVDISGQLMGIVTTIDIANADPRDLVSDYLTRHVISISPLAQVEEAIALLCEHDIGGLPVTLDNFVVGIVTRADVDSDSSDDFEMLPDKALVAN